MLAPTNADSGIPRRAFDNRAARLQLTLRDGILNDVERRPVLDRLAGVHKLGLAQNGAARDLGSPLQLEKRRISDGIGKIEMNAHWVRSFLGAQGVFGTRAKLKPRGPQWRTCTCSLAARAAFPCPCGCLQGLREG
jgi:hypothetical protein